MKTNSINYRIIWNSQKNCWVTRPAGYQFIVDIESALKWDFPKSYLGELKYFLKSTKLERWLRVLRSRALRFVRGFFSHPFYKMNAEESIEITEKTWDYLEQRCSDFEEQDKEISSYTKQLENLKKHSRSNSRKHLTVNGNGLYHSHRYH